MVRIYPIPAPGDELLSSPKLISTPQRPQGSSIMCLWGNPVFFDVCYMPSLQLLMNRMHCLKHKEPEHPLEGNPRFPLALLPWYVPVCASAIALFLGESRGEDSETNCWLDCPSNQVRKGRKLEAKQSSHSTRRPAEDSIEVYIVMNISGRRGMGWKSKQEVAR